MSIPRNLSKLAEGTDSSGILGIAYGGTGGSSQADAKAALGLHAVATSGSYADLLNKPTTANIVENTNLYFTDARARASVSASGSLSYNSATGVFSYTTPSTSGISEGTNLYYTDARARGALSASTGISYNSTTGAISTTITQYTDTLARGAVSASGDLSYNSTTGVFSYTTPSTSGIVEGTNLYFTDARARASISVTGAGSYNSTTGVINIVGGVTSFNTRTGAITLSSADVTSALGFTPYNATNPSGYLTGITSSQVTTALGFTPYNSTNPNGYITGITSSNVTTALGFTPYNATNPSGYISGITSGMVTTALGYTPYNSSNPSGYITSAALSGYLTSSTAASTYLPLTGGTLSGNLQVPRLGVGQAPDPSYPAIISGNAYLNANGSLYAEGRVYTRLPSGTFKEVLHPDNYTSYSPTLTGTGASGTWAISVSGNSATTSQRAFSGDISTTGQGRFTGWYAGGAATGFAVEVGISGGEGYILSYNRDTSSYGTLNLSATNIRLVPQGGTLTGPGGSVILHAGNYTSYSPSLGGSGASGTWNINITGSAGSASSVPWTGVSSGVRRNYDLGIQAPSDGGYAGFFFSKSTSSSTAADAGYILIKGSGDNFPPYTEQGITIVSDANSLNLFARGSTLVSGGNAWVRMGTGSAETFRLMGNYSYSLNSSRAPIFYDSNDTGNYLTMSGLSNINALTATRIGVNPSGSSSNGFGISLYNGYTSSEPTYGLMFQGVGTFGSHGGVNSDWATYFTMNNDSSRGWIFRNVGTGPVASITANGRMSIDSHFEQGNNYAHPNIEWSASGSSTGEVIFYLPGTTANYGMVHMVFDIYEYNSPRTATVTIGGHNWSTSWYNVACDVVGYTDKEVRLGVKDGRFVVVFGNSGSSWSYGTIRLRKIHNGSFYNNIMDMLGNWGVVQSTSGSFSNISGDLRALRTSTDFTAFGSVRSPIFYDSNDTNYYSNFADTTTSINVNGSIIINNGGSSNTHGLKLNGANSRIWFDNRRAIEGSSDGSNFQLGESFSFTTIYNQTRSPIFYDSNNTGYYTDPTSTSQFSTVNLNGTLSTGDVINIGGSQLGSVATANFRGIEFHSAGNRDYYIGKPAGAWTQPLHVYFYTGLRLIANPGYDYGTSIWHTDGTLQFSVGEGDNNTRIKYIGYAGNSFRAPIFYDSNDTNYYLDAASTSVFNRISTVRTNNFLYMDNNYGHSIVGAYSSYRYQGVFAMGDSYKLPESGETTGNLYGICWSHPNAGGTAGNLNTHGALILENGTFLAALSGSIRCRDDMRTPIYYDSNDTGYYLNPNSTTALRTVGSWRADSAAWDGEFSGKLQYHSSNWYFQYAGNMLFRNSGGSNVFNVDQSGNTVASGNITAYSDVRIKENIVTIDSALNKVLNLRGVYYNKIGNLERRVGVIAQEIETVLPEVVRCISETNPSTGETQELLAVDYGNITGLLIEATKEQNQEVLDLKNRVAQLEALIEKLIKE